MSLSLSLEDFKDSNIEKGFYKNNLTNRKKGVVGKEYNKKHLEDLRDVDFNEYSGVENSPTEYKEGIRKLNKNNELEEKIEILKESMEDLKNKELEMERMRPSTEKEKKRWALTRERINLQSYIDKYNK